MRDYEHEIKQSGDVLKHYVVKYCFDGYERQGSEDVYATRIVCTESAVLFYKNNAVIKLIPLKAIKCVDLQK